MKLVQVNVWMGRLTPTLIKFIKDEQPDIICMQEVFVSPVEVPVPNRQFTVGPEVQKTVCRCGC
jgi:exonuclease III